METLPAFSTKACQLKKGIYEHYSGKRYRVHSVGRHSESLDEYVVYEAQYGNHDFWLRPLAMFCEEVEINGKMTPRFKYIENA